MARGLLLGLKQDGRISASQLDRMYKRVHSVVPTEVLATIPPEYAADLGEGITVPTARGTRAAR